MTKMTIRHHISDPVLMAYAAGELAEAFNLIVATHVSMCDDCRAQLAAFEAVGGAVMEGEDKVSMSGAALEATLSRIELMPQATARARSAARGIFPAPLADYVGADLASVGWTSLGAGVRQAILPTDQKATARLLYIPAGARMPDHGHRGMEMTLVLQGAFADENDRFGRGDVEFADEGMEHTPVAEAGQDCICLAVTDAPLRFSGIVPRLVQGWFRI
jgi:putative transcriptional regulator